MVSTPPPLEHFGDLLVKRLFHTPPYSFPLCQPIDIAKNSPPTITQAATIHDIQKPNNNSTCPDVKDARCLIVSRLQVII